MNKSRMISFLTTLLILIIGSAEFFIKLEIQNLSDNLEIQNKKINQAATQPEVEDNAVSKELFDYINREKPKFFESDIADKIYILGQDISEKIINHNLEIEFYSIFDNDNRKYFNYALSGKPDDCIRLLQTLFLNQKYYEINSIDLNINPDSAKMTLIFAPAIIQNLQTEDLKIEIPLTDHNRADSPDYIFSRLFYHEPVKQPANPVTKEVNIEIEREIVPNAPIWLSYVGHSIENETEKFYFLDTRTKKTIEIIPQRNENFFEIQDFQQNGFTILLSGEKYYVSKN